jgi:hypothetical protein
MRHLQDQLSAHGAGEHGKHDTPVSPTDLQNVRPA